MRQTTIKLKGKVYRTEVISSEFSIEIEGDQIDIWYSYRHQEISVFVNGELVIQHHYTPARETFNLINLTEIAVKYRGVYITKKLQNQNLAADN